VASSAKVDYDPDARADRIARAITAPDELNQRLASPKTSIKTTVAIEQAATEILERASTSRWIRSTVDDQTSQRLLDRRDRINLAQVDVVGLHRRWRTWWPPPTKQVSTAGSAPWATAASVPCWRRFTAVRRGDGQWPT
jgi:hypothetical protein